MVCYVLSVKGRLTFMQGCLTLAGVLRSCMPSGSFGHRMHGSLPGCKVGSEDMWNWWLEGFLPYRVARRTCASCWNGKDVPWEIVCRNYDAAPPVSTKQGLVNRTMLSPGRQFDAANMCKWRWDNKMMLVWVLPERVVETTSTWCNERDIE